MIITDIIWDIDNIPNDLPEEAELPNMPKDEIWNALKERYGCNAVSFSVPIFLDDEEKMADFLMLTKKEFLYSYSYLSEAEYDATLEAVADNPSGYLVSCIEWDTDGEDEEYEADIEMLPDAIYIGNDIDEEAVADYLSDKYGWCVKSLLAEPVRELLKRFGCDMRETTLLGEVMTAAGVLRAYSLVNPGAPGICVMLQPAGYEEEIDVCMAEVVEDEDYGMSYTGSPVDVSVITWGDATSEDYTSKEIIRREDVIAGLGTAAHL